MTTSNSSSLELSISMPKDEFLKHEKSLNIEYKGSENFSIYVLDQDDGTIDIDIDITYAVLIIPGYINSIGYNFDIGMSRLLTEISAVLISSGMPWELYLEGPVENNGPLLIELIGYAKGTEMNLEMLDDLPKPALEFSFNIFPKI